MIFLRKFHDFEDFQCSQLLKIKYGQIFWNPWPIWPIFSTNMATIWPLFRWILTLFSVFIAFLCDNFCKKFQIWKEIFQIFFEKNFQSANLKILRWKLLEKFVFCHKILWMLNWKVKFGQNGPKINPKGPEMSIFLPKAKYGHICHENCGHISKNFMAKAIWNMATLAIYGHSWEHCFQVSTAEKVKV